MRNSFLSRHASALLALAIAVAQGRAHAEPSSTQKAAAAQALYDQAAEAMKQRDYASACPKLEEVVKLIPEGVGAKLTLAECYEGAGRLASAWTTYNMVEGAARNASQPQREKLAHERAEALKPKLARLTLEVPNRVQGLPGLEIARDGVPAGAAQWGVPVPVDKGAHVIVAKATGKQDWERTVVIRADGETQSVLVDGLVDAPVSASSPSVSSSSSSSMPRGERVPPQDEGAPSGRRTAGFVVGALGLASAGAGAFFLIRAFGKYHDSNRDGHCDSANACDPTGLSLRSDARTESTVSTVLFIAGGLALAGGVTLLATAPGAKQPASVGLLVGPGGALVRGRW